MIDGLPVFICEKSAVYHLPHHGKIIPGGGGEFTFIFDIETPIGALSNPSGPVQPFPQLHVSPEYGDILDFNTGWWFGQPKVNPRATGGVR